MIFIIELEEVPLIITPDYEPPLGFKVFVGGEETGESKKCSRTFYGIGQRAERVIGTSERREQAEPLNK